MYSPDTKSWDFFVFACYRIVCLTIQITEMQNKILQVEMEIKEPFKYEELLKTTILKRDTLKNQIAKIGDI
jgi:hypothetical protein